MGNRSWSVKCRDNFHVLSLDKSKVMNNINGRMFELLAHACDFSQRFTAQIGISAFIRSVLKRSTNTNCLLTAPFIHIRWTSHIQPPTLYLTYILSSLLTKKMFTERTSSTKLPLPWLRLPGLLATIGLSAVCIAVCAQAIRGYVFEF